MSQFETITKNDLKEFGLESEVPSSQPQTPELPKSQSSSEEDWVPEEYRKLDGFNNSAEFHAFFDNNINNGSVTPHKWQVEVPEELCAAKATSKHPFKYCLCAANGSGKDAFILAPFALWFICCKIRSLVIITTSSGTQLTAQTENYISTLASRVNTFYKDQFGINILKIRQRYIKCLISGSEIRMFATDEEGKAEGYHPLEPNREFAIIVNEAKSVPPEIFRALRRCTGFTYWINVSTPGEPHGDFYNAFKLWPHKRKITYYDCPHMSDEEFLADKTELGEHNYLFRSKWLALFTTIGGKVVISQISIEKLQDRIKAKLVALIGQLWPLRVGIDLSAGGDETVVSIWRGNKQIAQVTFRIKDTVEVSLKIEQILKEYKIETTHRFIFADDGGVGRSIIDMLVRRGWTIHRVLNQSPARNNKSEFRNRGAELWFKFSRLVEEGLIEPLNDDKLWNQLGSRRYKQTEGVAKITLESKAEAKADGLPSPDRADAAVLAFTDLNLQSFLNEVNRVEEPKNTATKDNLVEKFEEFLENRTVKTTPFRRSLKVLLKMRQQRNIYDN